MPQKLKKETCPNNQGTKRHIASNYTKKSTKIMPFITKIKLLQELTSQPSTCYCYVKPAI